MAERTFEIRTVPHKATIGNTTLLFLPEVVGTAFIHAYLGLQAVQMAGEFEAVTRAKVNSSKHSKAPSVDIERVKAASDAADKFLFQFLLPESQDEFTRLRPTLPDRVVVELIGWVAELYGGGSGNPDAAGGTSTG